MKNKIKRRYSGDNSRKFWDKINSLPHDLHKEASSLGVVLQNIEHDILNRIESLFNEENPENSSNATGPLDLTNVPVSPYIFEPKKPKYI